MMEFNDFKEYADEVRGCSAALAFVARGHRKNVTDEKTGIDFFELGLISTLDTLSIRLEQIARDIDKAVVFHESPEGESVRRILAAVAVKAVSE